MVESQNLITQEIQRQFIDEDEYVMVCERVSKLRVNGGQSENEERLYIMTFDRIYMFKSQKRSRLYSIKDVGAILSSSQNNNDFMLFFERSDDLHVSTKNRKDVLDLLKLRFNCLNRNITLRCYSVTNQQLLTYHKTNNSKNKIAGIYDLPDDSQRLLDDEIKGEEEYNAELRRKKATLDDQYFDDDKDDGFAFDNQKAAPAFGGFGGKKKEEAGGEDDFSDMR